MHCKVCRRNVQWPNIDPKLGVEQLEYVRLLPEEAHYKLCPECSDLGQRTVLSIEDTYAMRVMRCVERALQPGATWYCSRLPCKRVNFLAEEVCFGCGAARPSAGADQEPNEGETQVREAKIPRNTESFAKL